MKKRKEKKRKKFVNVVRGGGWGEGGREGRKRNYLSVRVVKEIRVRGV